MAQPTLKAHLTKTLMPTPKPTTPKPLAAPVKPTGVPMKPAVKPTGVPLPKPAAPVNNLSRFNEKGQPDPKGMYDRDNFWVGPTGPKASFQKASPDAPATPYVSPEDKARFAKQAQIVAAGNAAR